MKNFISWFIHFSMRGRNIPLFLGLYFMMVVLIMNCGAAQIEKKAGKQLNPLDLHFSYSPAYAYQLIGEYGAEGRSFYAIFNMTADLLYPIIYTFLLCALIGNAWKIFIEEQNFRLANFIFVPWTVLLFDYAENIAVFAMLKNYPTQMGTLASFSSIFTSAKWICFGLCAILILAGLIRRLVEHIRNQNSNSKT
jgi:hypothetical protein